MDISLDKYQTLIDESVKHFWDTRNNQTTNQGKRNVLDTGNRSAVTGGKQMDGFLKLLCTVAIDLGIPEECLYIKGNHIPGYFRPTKDWDLLILSTKQKLMVVVEMKSQVGSFGNNFNNRTEESLGSAVDLWTAFREKAYPHQSAPWVGYLMMVEKSDMSTRPVRLMEPHFEALPEFQNSSYLERYKILCEKLMLERHYSQCCLLWTKNDSTFGDVAEEISLQNFIYSFIGHLVGQMHEFKSES